MPITAPLPVVPAGPAAATCCAPSAGIDPTLDAARIAAFAKALGEPMRVQIVDVLQRSEQDICQCALIAVLGIHQSHLSYHIKKLTDAGIVSVERRHKWAYYTVCTDAAQELSAWLRCPPRAPSLVPLSRRAHARPLPDRAADAHQTRNITSMNLDT